MWGTAVLDLMANEASTLRSFERPCLGVKEGSRWRPCSGLWVVSLQRSASMLYWCVAGNDGIWTPVVTEDSGAAGNDCEDG